MKRSDFLAFIPAMSALPFIGTDIIKTDKGILVANPEIVKPENGFSFSDFDLRNVELRMYHKEQCIGKAYLTNITWSNPLYDHEYAVNGREAIVGANRCKIEAEVVDGLILTG